MNQVIDFDNPRECVLIHNHLRSLKGLHRVEVVKHRPRRSDRANRFYWPACVVPLSEWMSEEYGEKFDPDDAHEMFKRCFLTRTFTGKHGRKMTVVGSSAKLNDLEFSEYVDKCIHLLASYCGIIVSPSPASQRS